MISMMLFGSLWNFYPRPPRGGRLRLYAFAAHQNAISIHALREEGDLTVGDPSGPESVFLSTPSARRATCIPILRNQIYSYFYPRPPRGGRLFLLCLTYAGIVFLSTPSARRATHPLFTCRHSSMISIHALREEGDALPVCRAPAADDFYPRPPRGGRHGVRRLDGKAHRFLSTPSARRATAHRRRAALDCLHFYPRPPRGGRHPGELYGA